MVTRQRRKSAPRTFITLRFPVPPYCTPVPARDNSNKFSASLSWCLLERYCAQTSVCCDNITYVTAFVLRSAQLLVSLPPTSDMGFKTPIHNLDDDSILQIFSCYRLEDEFDWYLRLAWLKLVHVCPRWRKIIYDSWSHLDMCLLLTNNSPSIDTLSHLPPLPLVVHYSDRTSRTIARKDEDNMHLALQQHDRVRQVTLWAPSSSLRMWLEPMNTFFPRLGHFSLMSTTTEEMGLVLPELLRAPNLRHLLLHGVGLPKITLFHDRPLNTLPHPHPRLLLFPPWTTRDTSLILKI